VTDIVERLRTTMREAIFEIERLRGNGNVHPDMAFLDVPLRDIDFGRLMNARAHNLRCWRLENDKMVSIEVTTVRDLVMLTEAEILRSHNTGRATLEAIKAVLAQHGLSLGMGL
jgi:DNA-directed RNA polymerase alpha subunit